MNTRREFWRILILLSAVLWVHSLAQSAAPAHSVDPGVESAAPARSAADLAVRAGRSLSAGLHLEALGLAEDGLDIDPAYLPLMRVKALALTRLGRPVEADAALTLALAAVPGDADMNALAIQNDMTLFPENSQELQARLISRFQAMPPEALPTVAARILGEMKSPAAQNMILKSLVNAGVLTGEPLDIARSLAGGQARDAAGRVRGAAEKATAETPLIAAFAFVAGQALSLGENAEGMLRIAENLGFDKPTAREVLAKKFLEEGRAREAGETYADFWQQSPEPNRVAAQAAEAFALAGDQIAAIRVLEEALTASPHEAFLQGRYLFTLLESGHTGRANAFEKLLAQHNGQIGIHYGRYLHARANGQSAEAGMERNQTYSQMSEVTQRHSHESIRYIQADTDYYAGVADQAFILYNNEGWRAWEEGQFSLALKNWERAFALNPALAEHFAPGVVNTLLLSGMDEAARRLLGKYLPAMSPADFDTPGSSVNPDAIYDAIYAQFRTFLEAQNYVAARSARDRLAAFGSGAGFYAALAEYGLGRFAAAERVLRGLLRDDPRNAGAAGELVMTLRALGRMEEAEGLLAAFGIPDPDNPYYLRRQTEQSLERGYPELAESYAAQSLAAYPTSGYMHNLYLLSLLEQGKLAALDAHANVVLAGNPINSLALRALMEKSTALRDQLATKGIARRLAEAFPFDPAEILQDAMQSVNEGSMKYSYDAVREVAQPGVNGAATVWAFPELRRVKEGRAFTIDDLDWLLRKTADRNVTVSLSDIFYSVPTSGRQNERAADRIPTLLLFSAMAESDLQRLDAVLARRGARAALVVTEDSFIPGTPDNMPGAAFLRQLAATDRWDFVLSDVLRYPAGFWDGPARLETTEEMRRRLSAVLKTIKQRAAAAGFPIETWAYPQGDYGQSKIDFGPQYAAAYDAAVREHFPRSFVATPTGYHLAGPDPARLPYRAFYSRPTGEEIRALGYNHPSRQAVLDEGAIAGWHGQIPRGQMLLKRAEALGLLPADVAFYLASNAYYGEDVPQANQRARKAAALNPDAARTASLLRRTRVELRPVLTMGFRDWWDDDGRGYLEDWLTITDYVTEKFSLYATTSIINWDSAGESARGEALGGGFRYHLFDDHWLEGRLRAVRVTGADSFADWALAWRGVASADFLGFNGIYQFQYSRESMETLESIEEGVYADRLSLTGNFRFLNWGVLESNVYTTLRTDGNQTTGLSLHPAWIVWDKPNLRLGYRLDMADSDQNPDEYYAPEAYQAHLATVRVEHQLTPWLRVNAVAEYGMGKSRGTDGWENITRCGGDVSLAVTDSLSVDAGYRKLQLPDYESDQVTGGLTWVF